MDRMASIQEMAELDLNDPLFKTDAFMVYGFKVLQCRRTRRHDWRECPFAHPGEVARRRDPRVYTYVGIICPDAKQNSPCPRGDRCPYTHSLFEYWLHPTRYKTEFCSRGRQCTRPFCFFAHSETEMRPVDTEALLAVAMCPQIETTPTMSIAPPQPPMTTHRSLDDAVAQTTDWLQGTQFFGQPPLRSQSFSDRSLTRGNGFYDSSFGDLTALRSHNSSSLLTSRTSSFTAPWDTIYENGHPAMDHTSLDLHRRYSSSDTANPSDVISRLGLGYLQQSAKQRHYQQNGNGLNMGGGGVTLAAVTAATTPLLDLTSGSAGATNLSGIYAGIGRHSKSLDAALLPSNSEAQLQALLAERGHSLPTTLPQNSGYFY